MSRNDLQEPQRLTRNPYRRLLALGFHVVMGLALVVAALPTSLSAAEAPVVVRPTYLYDLSTFTGMLPISYARIAVDEKRNEVYVADPGSHAVRIFNSSGLQVYSFGEDDERFGQIEDVVVPESGDIIVLSSGQFLLCNYRGEIRKIFKLQGLPPALSTFRPTRMVLRQGHLYLAQDKTLQVVVTDLDGQFIEQIDLAAMLNMTPKDVSKSGLGGFNVAEDGTIYFTIPVNFHGYRLPPGSKEPQEFGEGGDAPGKFGVVQGIAPGPDGLIYVADVLKSTVIIFDKNFNFITEFGGRSGRRGGLWSPVNLASTSDCRLYVTQRAKHGISVFRICD